MKYLEPCVSDNLLSFGDNLVPEVYWNLPEVKAEQCALVLHPGTIPTDFRLQHLVERVQLVLVLVGHRVDKCRTVLVDNVETVVSSICDSCMCVKK